MENCVVSDGGAFCDVIFRRPQIVTFIAGGLPCTAKVCGITVWAVDESVVQNISPGEGSLDATERRAWLDVRAENEPVCFADVQKAVKF